MKRSQSINDRLLRIAEAHCHGDFGQLFEVEWMDGARSVESFLRAARDFTNKRSHEKLAREVRAEFGLSEQAQPYRSARQWRADGWLCVFVRGLVIIVPPAGECCAACAADRFDFSAARTRGIDQGRWMSSPDPQLPPWTSTLDLGRDYQPLLRAIARDCYCSSFPQTGCDFCNGTRLPDGAKET